MAPSMRSVRPAEQPVLERNRLALARAFGRAQGHYWLDIHPRVRRELRHWQARAQLIPDPQLRALALEAQRNETAKAEGAAAFAILAPRGCRGALVRAQVAFATLFDYVDTLGEQPSDDPVANGRQLHQALLVALDPATQEVNYYAHSPVGDDGGYLQDLVETWGGAFSALASYRQVVEPMRGLVEVVVRYQTLNLSERHGGHAQLADWARTESASDSRLQWWERAAGSSYMLGILALMAAAARPAITSEEAVAIEAAYTLWVEAVCTLLDSAADEAEDAAMGQRSLISYYGSPEEAAARLSMLANEAVRHLGALPNASEHLILFAGLLCSYLSPPPATATGRAIARPVLETVGPLAMPTDALFRTRRRLQAIGARMSGRRRATPTPVGQIPLRDQPGPQDVQRAPGGPGIRTSQAASDRGAPNP